MAGFKELIAYKKARQLANDIFEITKLFPAEEKYSLTDQIRRSSRSVCACMAEAYRKRRYPAHFISKLSDADMENGETDVWLDFSKDCQYIADEKYHYLTELNGEVAKLLFYMMEHPDKFINYK